MLKDRIYGLECSTDVPNAETLYLSSIPGMKEKIIDGLKTPIEECASEEEVQKNRVSSSLDDSNS